MNVHEKVRKGWVFSVVLLISVLAVAGCSRGGGDAMDGYVSMSVSEDASPIVLTRIHTQTSARPSMLPGPPRSIQSVSQDTWEDLWKGALIGEKPDIDFRSEIVLALALDTYVNRIEGFYSPTHGYQLPPNIAIPLEITPATRLEMYRAPRP